MITLKEAFKLCRVDDGEVIHLCDSAEYAPLWSLPITGTEVRKKYDMRRTMVTAIMPHYCVGEFDGFTFLTFSHGETPWENVKHLQMWNI